MTLAASGTKENGESYVNVYKLFGSDWISFATFDSTDNHNISIYNELYLMDYETGKVERLTNHLGYDGGPFFDYSGEKVCWRRFSPDGHNAEIYVMSLKTRKERKITHLNAMSWAPFFHPSDKYIIFSEYKFTSSSIIRFLSANI